MIKIVNYMYKKYPDSIKNLILTLSKNNINLTTISKMLKIPLKSVSVAFLTISDTWLAGKQLENSDSSCCRMLLNSKSYADSVFEVKNSTIIESIPARILMKNNAEIKDILYQFNY